MTVSDNSLVGQIFDTNGGTKCKIISGTVRNKVRVKFLDSFGYEVDTRVADLEKGYVKNPFAPAVCGVGYLGTGRYTPSVDGKKTLAYVQWHGVVRRSYDLTYKNKQASYRKTNMCKEWHCFNTYAEWFYQQKGWDKGFQLDKDILGNGDGKYSPETCCLVPLVINSMFSSGGTCKGKWAIGVRFNKKDKKFYATTSKKGVGSFLGCFNTEEDAFFAYKKDKQEKVRGLAMSWKGEIEDKVFDALYNLEMTEKGWLTKEDSAFKFYETGEVEIPEYYQDNLHLVGVERVEGLEVDYE